IAGPNRSGCVLRSGLVPIETHLHFLAISACCGSESSLILIGDLLSSQCLLIDGQLVHASVEEVTGAIELAFGAGVERSSCPITRGDSHRALADSVDEELG